jgi:hypothetical protein
VTVNGYADIGAATAEYIDDGPIKILRDFAAGIVFPVPGRSPVMGYDDGIYGPAVFMDERRSRPHVFCLPYITDIHKGSGRKKKQERENEDCSYDRFSFFHVQHRQYRNFIMQFLSYFAFSVYRVYKPGIIC